MTDRQFTNCTIDTLIDRLKGKLGIPHVLTDQKTLTFHSLDFSEETGSTASAVIQPATTQEVAEAAKLCSSAGAALVPRGAGMSYTMGYVPKREYSVIVDLSRMNRISVINTDDLFITVEAGVAWKQIHSALLELDYWIPFLGPVSGMVATVGGGLGNNCVGLGKGDINDYLLGIEVVLSDGRIIQTGGRATGDPIPLLRHFGPDLTGVFVHDGGAFGIKTKATFRLVHRPGGTSFASFGFEDRERLVSTMCECARLGVASELTGLARYHHRQFASEPPPTKSERNAIVQKIIGTSSSRWRGIRDLLRSARPSGVKFLGAYEYSFHAVVDGFNQRTADRGLAAIKGIAKKQGGKKLPPILPLVMRSDPFQPIGRLIQGIQGSCSIPSNCVVPLSRAHELTEGLERFWQEHSATMQQHALEKTCNYLISNDMFGIEPILFWRDKPNPLRFSVLNPTQKNLLENTSANLEARQTAIKLRRKLLILFSELGGTHYGIGKYYRYRQNLQSEDIWSLLDEMKTVLDPGRLMNPGVLGLE